MQRFGLARRLLSALSMTTLTRGIGTLLAAVAWTIAPPCRAQSPGKAVLHVHGSQPGLTYEMVPHRQQAAGTRCSDPCEVVAPPGNYDLRVFRDGEKLGTGRVAVETSADLQVSPPDKETSRTGLALGVMGSALFMGGLMAIALAGLSCDNEYGCSKNQVTTMQIGLGAMVGGAIMAPIGWVMFAKNRRPRIEVLPPGTATPSSSALGSPREVALRFGVAPSPHGGSFAAALTF